MTATSDVLPTVIRTSAALILALGSVAPPLAQTPQTASPPCSIVGTAAAGSTPIPGIAITATSIDGREVAATSSEQNGTFVLRLPSAGTYTIHAGLAAFAPITRDVVVPTEPCATRVDLALVLASRAQTASGSTPPRTVPAPTPSSARPSPGGRGVAGAPSGRAGGFQELSVVANGDVTEAAGVAVEQSAEALGRELQLPPGFSADAPTETVATTGNQGQLNEALLFGGRGEGPGGFDRPFQEGGFGEGGTQGLGGFGGGGRGGGPGGIPGGPGGAFAGLRGGGGRMQGTATYTLGGSMFDAAPYPLNGRAVSKPEYVQQRFGASFGGGLKIPHIYNGGTRTSFFFNYGGNHSRNPVDAYSTVPTLAERGGDFAALGAVVIDPATGSPFDGSRIPDARIDPASRVLLSFIPQPNLPGTTQNFHYVTSVGSSSDDLNFRLTHVFGAEPPQRGGRGGPGRGGAGRGGFAPGGGRGAEFGGRGGRGPARPRSVLSVSVSYRKSTAIQSSSFPSIGGTTAGTGWNVPVSYMYAKGRFNNMLNVNFNRNDSRSSNLYGFTTDVAGAAGIQGVSTDPFDWGIPGLSFTTIADLRDRSPSRRIDRRLQISDTMMRSVGRHAVRWGGDYREIRLDSVSNSNPRGSFVFTGLYTSAIADGRPLPGTGLDFADFLLGLAQQASVQYGPGEINLRGRAWNLFLQDDWRPRGNLTLNLGLRYEYVSPFTEADGQLVNLDVSPGFTAAAAVQAGGVGAFTGPFPLSLVAPDRNNLAPRVGIAWKPRPTTTVRTGYGVNYNLGAYGTIAQKLAGQPPFAVSATSLGTLVGAVAITDPFVRIDSETTTNSYGIDRGYQLGIAQIWNLDLQRDLPRNLTLGVGYTGTRGSSLDIQRAPNRNPDGSLRIPDTQPFIWQSSGGRSTLYAVNVRARKRLARGVSFGGSYTWSHAYDNASSIGGGGATVAQNDQDLAAEWGRSSFERRHSAAGDYAVELPWGRGRRWLNGEDWRSEVLGGWSWSGNLSIQSGAPFTARVTGAFRDVATGVNGTLRADYNGQPIALGDPTTLRFFNTAAFSVPPAGQFGTAERNTITGPGSFNVNMALSKNVNVGRNRGVSLRVQANNIFNRVQFSAIDAVVNSPTFGQVVAVRPMRSVQLVMRVRF